MSEFVRILTEVPIDNGGHSSTEGKACVMEKVAILWALNNGLPVDDVWTDTPICTNGSITYLAQGINDGLNDEERQKLNHLIPRLLRARQGAHEEQIAKQMTLWALEKLTEQVKLRASPYGTITPKHVMLAERTMAFVRGLVENGEAPQEEWDQFFEDMREFRSTGAPYAIVGCYDSAVTELSNERHWDVEWDTIKHDGVTYETVNYGDGHGMTANIITSLRALNRWGKDVPDVDLVMLLDEALDKHEELRIKMGEDIYVPEKWEDEALSFVAAYMGDEDEGEVA